MVAVLDNVGEAIIRFYYTVTANKGDQKSTLRIDKITAQRKEGYYSYPGNYFAYGKFIVNGETIFEPTIEASNGQTGFYPTGSENVIADYFWERGITVDIDQPLGNAVDVRFEIQGLKFWSVSEGFWMRDGNTEGTLDRIPQFEISLNYGSGYTITAYRMESPVSAPIDYLASGGSVYTGDVIRLRIKTTEAYLPVAIIVNGEQFNDGAEIVVSGDMDVSGIVKLQGGAHIGGEKYLLYIDNGNAFEQYVPYIYIGTGWTILS